MEITFPVSPPPAEMARAWTLALGVGTGARLFAAWLRRDAESGVMAVLAHIVFLASAAVLVTIGLSLVYPHHHHDTRWTGSADWNYFVDVAIGCLFWAAVVLCYRFVWRRHAA
jgi:uncharacterized BrkB/YihY/UPF0761 family membrane protein